MNLSKLWRKITNETNKNTEPIQALSKAILNGSLDIANSLRPSMDFKSHEENEKHWVYILFEVQYIFFHLVSRMASKEIGPDKRSTLLHSIAPLVIDPTIHSIFGQWPEDQRENIASEYYKNLAESEYEYGACKSLWNDDGVDDMNEVVMHRFGKNIAQVMGNGHNLGLIIDFQNNLVNTLKDIEFNRLLHKVFEELRDN